MMRCAPILLALVAGMVAGMTIPAYSAGFSLSPVEVTLDHGERSQLISLTDQDVVPLRFQVHAFKWDQRPDGQMVLTPTDDVIFFPRLFDIAPHSKQNIRVGVIAPAVDGEKTYRLEIRQLKSFQQPLSQQPAERAAIVNVLTNVSIPVFVEPTTASAQPSLGPLSINNGTLNFTIRNPGNAHFLIKSIRADAFSGGSQLVFSKTTRGWYVLAGGSRTYELAIPNSDCVRVSRLGLTVETDHGNATGESSVNRENCSAD